MLRPQPQQESETINLCYPNPFPKWFTHNLRLNKYSLEEILNNEEAALIVKKDKLTTHLAFKYLFVRFN